VRAIAIIRGCGCLHRSSEIHREYRIKDSSGWRKDGELVLQYDHLNSRQFNVSYVDLRPGVIICKDHYGWKHFTDANKKLYDKIMRVLIGTERAELWDRVENDWKTYP
jgi:hypothetical protein